MYKMFEKLSEVCNEIVQDLQKRLVENPNMVEQIENRWIWEIISRIPDQDLINDLQNRLEKFDKEKL